MRLIDADALLEALNKIDAKSWNKQGMTGANQGVRYLNEYSVISAITNAPAIVKVEPFGYFKAEPFGWTDCAETDEGAIALYEAPPQPQTVREALEEAAKICDDKVKRITDKANKCSDFEDRANLNSTAWQIDNCAKQIRALIEKEQVMTTRDEFEKE